MYLGQLLEGLGQEEEVATVCFADADDPPAPTDIRSFRLPRFRRAELGRLRVLLDQMRYAFGWGIRGLPLEVAKHRSGAFRQLLRRAVEEFNPDVAMVEFAVMAQYLPDLGSVKTVFTDHEHGESLPPRIGPGQAGRNRDRRLWQSYIRHYLAMADLCQALTSEDAARLEELTGRPVVVRPPLVELPTRPVSPEATGQIMLFLGDYRHHPNPEAAAVIARDVLPAVREQFPDAELWLAGPRSEGRVDTLVQYPGVHLLGYVEDLAGLMAKARFLVAPVFSGSGVRIKVLTAMAHGLPVVSNGLGMQGVPAPAEAYRSGETPAELARACEVFLRDPAKAASAGQSARSFVKRHMDRRSLVEQQLGRIRSIL